MTQYIFANNVNTSLFSAITSTATSLTLLSATNLPTLAAGQVMPLTLNDKTTRSIFEIVYVTAISGTNLTVIRGQEGTAAQNWNAGDYAYSTQTAQTTELAIQSGAYNYATDTGTTANAYVVSLTPAIPTTIPDGFRVNMYVTAARVNTGAATLNGVAIVDRNGNPILGGQIKGMCAMEYSTAYAKWMFTGAKQEVSILDFGADPTGGANSTPAFSNAGSLGSLTIVNPGTYLLNTVPTFTGIPSWLIKPGVTFTGAGVGAQTPLPGVCIFENNIIKPIGNATNTLCYSATQAVTQETATREFGLAAGLYAVTGSGQVSPAADKVALFGGIEAAQGSLNVWGINTSTIIDGSNTSVQGAWGYELDMNNHNANYGTAGGASGFSAPSSYGMQITGSSSFSNTAAISVDQTSGAYWNRGLATNQCIQSAFEDRSTNATRFLYPYGTYIYGMDTLNAGFSAGAIRLANGHLFLARNAGNTADITIATIDSSNDLVLGGGSALIIAQQSVIPGTDNAYQLGTSANRWSVVYAVNGTIQTSDKSLKTDIKNVPDCLNVVKSIKPVTYKWIEGGQEEYEEEVSVTRHKQTKKYHTRTIVKILEGKATEIIENYEDVEYEYVEMPVYDKDGKPVLIKIPERQEVRNAEGKIVVSYIPERTVQKTHREPVMETVTEKIKKFRSRPGKRTHWGFLADSLKDIPEKTGVEDFAGYVEGEDGTQHMRPDQLIPVLWKAVQELADKIAILEAKA